MHLYTGSTDDLTNMLHAHQAERAIRATRALIERAAYVQGVQNPPKIAYDEWNVWYREPGAPLEERYNIADALAVGTYLNIFVRNSDVVRMANLAQLVNVIAPIVTTPEKAVVQPIFYPILMHAQAALDTAVDVAVEGETVDVTGREGESRWPHSVADMGPFTLLDAAATVSRSRDKVAVTIANRGAEASVEIALADGVFDGPVRVRSMTAERDPSARIIGDIETAQMDEGSETATGGRLTLTLPARSFTVLERQHDSDLRRSSWRHRGGSCARSVCQAVTCTSCPAAPSGSRTAPSTASRSPASRAPTRWMPSSRRPTRAASSCTGCRRAAAACC